MPRNFKLKPNNSVEKCPKCGNNIDFVGHSNRVCEDACEVWVVCKCGYDPTTGADRFEDVWGGTSDDNMNIALSCWNDAIEELTNMK